jgi:release factor glutamine methyltransferase
LNTIVYYKGEAFTVDPEVYEPAEDTFLLADNLNVREGERVLELGTGCGLLSILAARAGARVVATDINPLALACARKNIDAHGVSDLIELRLGNLFEAVDGERFDVVIFNPPYLPVRDDEVIGSRIDLAWEGGPEGRAVIDPFLEGLSSHLVDDGRALLVQSSLSNIPKTLYALRTLDFKVDVSSRKLPFEELFLLSAAKLKSG